MNTEVLNIKTYWNRRGKPPVFRISKNGHIRFSVEAVKLIGIKEGDKLTFVIHKNDPGILYFHIDNINGFKLKIGGKYQSGYYLQILCRPLSLRLLSHFNITKNETFDITNDKTRVNDNEAWFVLKSNKHIPIKWRKQS